LRVSTIVNIVGGKNLNKLFKKYIMEMVEDMDGNFTSSQLLERMISIKGNRHYIGTVSAIGWLLTRLPNVEKVKNGVYRRKK
tara:strand:- start:4512 stop:4757 length:246 start_codon:yes stop_codon:yes gene_type:complete